ncbi:4-demethylwyosine synthase TYW1 [Candidatus Bathyarchaeota archaeon]|nr:4-demethylwyosine synthase TYW1 [Candidatus Bathyarchaeota archaeon]
MTEVPNELKQLYIKQKYRIAGNHSAVKTCMWLSKALRTSGMEHCYKQKFYGIPCHRCLQMTPSLGHCTQSCVFCWRATPEIIGVNWNQIESIKSPDNPDQIVENSIIQHKNLIYGFGGNKNVTEKFLKEALNPIHAAISLEGEPTLFPLLGELINSFYKHGFKTVFVVTNGTSPEVLGNLEYEPSQLYLSLCAPDEETYKKTCRPMIPNAWNKVLESLEILKSFSCPTVLRHTLIPKLNMKNIDGYAKLAIKTNPTYLEPKAAMSVGAARKRFSYKEMARHSDIKDFAIELSKSSGYNIIDEQWQSNIVLLSKLKNSKKLY